MLDHMKLGAEQLADYDRDGFLLLENFVSAAECDRLRAHAEELVREFDPRGIVSIFSTREQTPPSCWSSATACAGCLILFDPLTQVFNRQA